MDFTVLYIILACMGIVGVVFGISYLVKKFKIDPKDILDGIDISKAIVIFVKITAKDMKFGTPEEIDKIANITLDTLEYIKTLTDDTTKEEKIQEGIEYAESLCLSFDLELNEDRKYIIVTLITAGFNLFETLQNKEIVQ